MNCPYCNLEISPGELHYCPLKPPMIRVNIIKIWNWLKLKFKETNEK